MAAEHSDRHARPRDGPAQTEPEARSDRTPYLPTDGKCIREVLDRVGDKWSVMIIVTLEQGARRFSELYRSVEGISQRMLTLTLRHLERDGLVTRSVFAEVPPRVEYTLTALGRTLLPPLIALAQWAVTHQAEIETNRARFDQRSSPGCGHAEPRMPPSS